MYFVSLLVDLVVMKRTCAQRMEIHVLLPDCLFGVHCLFLAAKNVNYLSPKPYLTAGRARVCVCVCLCVCVCVCVCLCVTLNQKRFSL